MSERVAVILWLVLTWARAMPTIFLRKMWTFNPDCVFSLHIMLNGVMGTVSFHFHAFLLPLQTRSGRSLRHSFCYFFCNFGTNEPLAESVMSFCDAKTMSTRAIMLELNYPFAHQRSTMASATAKIRKCEQCPFSGLCHEIFRFASLLSVPRWH